MEESLTPCNNCIRDKSESETCKFCTMQHVIRFYKIFLTSKEKREGKSFPEFIRGQDANLHSTSEGHSN